jgi:hypothetical protein
LGEAKKKQILHFVQDDKICWDCGQRGNGKDRSRSFTLFRMTKFVGTAGREAMATAKTEADPSLCSG